MRRARASTARCALFLLVACAASPARADDDRDFTWTAGLFGGAGLAPMTGDLPEAPTTPRIAPSLGLTLGMRLTLDDWMPELRVRGGLPFLLAGAELRLAHVWTKAPGAPYLGLGAGAWLAGVPHQVTIYSVPVSINGQPSQGSATPEDSFEAGHDGFGAGSLSMHGGFELARGEESRLLLDVEGLVLLGPSYRGKTVPGLQGAALLVGLDGALSPKLSNVGEEWSPKLLLGGGLGAIDGLILGSAVAANVSTDPGIGRSSDGALVLGGSVVGAVAGGIAGVYLGDAAENSTLARVGLVVLGIGVVGTVVAVASIRD